MKKPLFTLVIASITLLCCTKSHKQNSSVYTRLLAGTRQYAMTEHTNYPIDTIIIDTVTFTIQCIDDATISINSETLSLSASTDSVLTYTSKASADPLSGAYASGTVIFNMKTNIIQYSTGNGSNHVFFTYSYTTF